MLGKVNSSWNSGMVYHYFARNIVSSKFQASNHSRFLQIVPWDSSPFLPQIWENIFWTFSRHRTCKFLVDMPIALVQTPVPLLEDDCYWPIFNPNSFKGYMRWIFARTLRYQMYQPGWQVDPFLPSGPNTGSKWSFGVPINGIMKWTTGVVKPLSGVIYLFIYIHIIYSLYLKS